MTQQLRKSVSTTTAGAVELTEARLDAASGGAGTGTVLFRLAEDNQPGGAQIVDWNKVQELRSGK